MDYDSRTMTHYVWISMTHTCILVDILMDIIWQWLQFILIDLAQSLVFIKYSLIHIINDYYHRRLVLSFHKIFNHVADDLNKSVFLKTNNSQAKLTNSISSVFSFWQIRLKMTLDLRLVTNHLFPKYSLIPFTCEIFQIYSLTQK